MDRASSALFRIPPSSLPNSEWRELAEILFATTGVDLGQYRASQTAKRLEHIAAQQDLSVAELTGLCLNDPGRPHRLLHDFVIQTTQFFRDPEHWSVLRETILPRLIGGRGRLRAWSAACANGPEAYSLAAAMHQASGSDHEVLATDIDPYALEHARAGTYSRSQARGIPPGIRRDYFVEDVRGVRVRTDLARQVTFKTHDLLGAFPTGPFDLIACRNVAIYFGDTAREALFRKLHAALNPGGILFLGATERIFSAREIGLIQVAPCFYARGTG